MWSEETGEWRETSGDRRVGSYLTASHGFKINKKGQ